MNERPPRSFLSRHPRLKRVAYTLYGVLMTPVMLAPLPRFQLPKRAVYACGRRIGLCIAYPLIAKKTRINLFFVYGDRMSARRAEALGRKVAINAVYAVLDCYYLWLFWWAYRASRIIVDVANFEHLDLARKAGKGGAIVATAHYGCFEIMPVFFSECRRETHGGVIARSFPSPFLDWLCRRARLLHGVPSFYDQARDVMRALRNNGVVGVLPDLRAKRRMGTPTTFFGKATLTFDIHARVAAHCGCPIVPAFLMRHKRRPWQYTLQFYPALFVPPKSGNAALHAAVQRINDALEWHIRRYPSGWMWINNKWRLW